MKPTNIVLLALILAIGGTWAKKSTINTAQVVGGGFLIIMFVIMQESQPKLAQQFSWLLLATAVGAYGTDVFTVVGKLTGANDTTGAVREGEKKA